MMTEWGGDDCGGSDARKQAECIFVQDLADRHLQSWALWGMFDDQDFADGALTPQKSDVLSRSYAQAVAGSVVNMTFDKASRAFQLCYELDASIEEPTVIYIAAAIFYKDNPVITTTANVIAHARYRHSPSRFPLLTFPTLSQQQHRFRHTRFPQLVLRPQRVLSGVRSHRPTDCSESLHQLKIRLPWR